MPVAVHTLASCAVPGSSRIDLSALGDFATSNTSRESLPFEADHAPLSFPRETLAIEASVGNSDVDPRFIAYSERQQARLDFLLWPAGAACELFRGTYPVDGEGEAMGYAASNGLVMLAGSNEGTSASVVGALIFDTRRGFSRLIEPRNALREPRAFATITQFGQRLLVAGGENPIHEAGHGPDVLRASAEVFDPASGRFEPELVPLVEPTTRHGAATLKSGETVLIGGQNAASTASKFIQIVSPDSRLANLSGTLSVGRSNPTVLRLSDDRLFIAGGEDEAGKPVAALEWRGADGAALPPPFDGSLALPARYDRAYVATAGGSVLGLGGCEDRPPALGESCQTWCRRGCPPQTSPQNDIREDAYWISPDGRVERFELPFGVGRPYLLPGSDGRPWLIASALSGSGVLDANDYALYRFDPWRQRFDEVSAHFVQRPSAQPLVFQATDLDAFVWFEPSDAGAVLRGARFGTRSPFVNDVSLVTLRDAEDPSRPAHLTPDRSTGSHLHYDSQLGALDFEQRSADDSGPCAYVADAQYADFSAKVAVSSERLPTVRLGSQSLLEPASNCPLPMSRNVLPGAVSIELQRRGTRVSMRTGTAQSECTLQSERVAFGICGSTLGQVRVTALSIVRDSR